VIKSKDGNTFIMDTKWKLLNDNSNTNYGMSQGDMYQMYAYHKKYEINSPVSCVTLIYPKPFESFTIPTFRSDDNVKLQIIFFDMFDVENSIQSIKTSITN
jgi:5-methylcytosine-specific restriction enzyme subunit McrC